MIVTHKNKKVSIPEESWKAHLLAFTVGIIIDFAPIFSPGVILISWLYIKYSDTLFVILYILSLFLSLYWMYLFFINFYRIKTNTFRFKNKKITEPVTFVYISDLHLGKRRYGTNLKRLRKIIDILNNTKKDFILFGGDILDFAFNEDLLNELSRIEGRKLTVLGNHDGLYLNRGFYGKETPVKIIKKLEEIGFEVLTNSGASLSNQLFVGGIKDLYTLDFDVKKAFIDSKSDQYKILLSHNPDIISFEEELNNVDLILSGHNHAGQIGMGKLRLPMPSIRQWLIKGVYLISPKTTLLLSQGVGIGHMRIRIGTEFEICKVKLLPDNN